ncbi:MAG TPA: histidine kinase [Bryobacteraceae bacterium]|nr:histidine kinase [Bryobacteraceae bacterium]HOQ45081.1 histidine kinase [Bryobacteraceae bacterium]HPQ13706.1 histidine kinase [Bryobacteraceae bacterium]HPU71153.1 histidine kinase [Bryobacteraceae bacterium]
MASPYTAGHAALGHGASLLNMAGHGAGAIIFAIFLFLLARDRTGARPSGNLLAMAAAALAFAWNLGALALIAMPPGHPLLSDVVGTIAFSSLSLLAPVLLHLSLGHRCRLAIAGYATGAVAALLHLAEIVFARSELHVYALGLMSVGLGGVTLASAVHLARLPGGEREGVVRRLLGAGVLFVFVGTYVHIALEQGAHTWSHELVLHHASIPLALFIILHNHRFVLLDALVRFCANFVLAALFAFLCLRLIRAEFLANSVAGEGGFVLAVCLLFLLFVLARSRLQGWMTRIVFRRGDSAALAAELRSASGFKDEAAYLDWATGRIAAFMHAERIPAGDAAPALSADVADPREALRLGRRRGGQPYMSEDLQLLREFASIVAERAQAIREAELRRLAANAELRALQAQINPHFLFNALNTLYGLIPGQAADARRTVLNLADIFRYFLKNENTTIPLEEELRIVDAYLQIETLRLGGRLRTEIHADPAALRVPIPILSIQPLVENAVKHGIAPHAAGGSVCLEARLSGGNLTVTVRDTGAGFRAAGQALSNGMGVGLENVERRLKLAYGPDAGLRIESVPGATEVSFTIPVAQPAEAAR